MTENEAIKIIEEKACNNRCIPQLCNDGCMYKNTKCAFSMAIKALEKQIPKKPDFTEDKEFALCPCCNGNGLADKQKYCDNCGQKLDWSNAE